VALRPAGPVRTRALAWLMVWVRSARALRLATAKARGAIVTPGFVSSPWIRLYPLAVSFARRTATRAMPGTRSGGLPGEHAIASDAPSAGPADAFSPDLTAAVAASNEQLTLRLPQA
jgi:hypothetical protein